MRGCNSPVHGHAHGDAHAAQREEQVLAERRPQAGEQVGNNQHHERRRKLAKNQRKNRYRRTAETACSRKSGTHRTKAETASDEGNMRSSAELCVNHFDVPYHNKPHGVQGGRLVPRTSFYRNPSSTLRLATREALPPSPPASLPPSLPPLPEKERHAVFSPLHIRSSSFSHHDQALRYRGH